MANIDLLEKLRNMRLRCRYLQDARAAAVADVAELKAVDYSSIRVSGGAVRDVSDLLIRAEAREEQYFKAWHEQQAEYMKSLDEADRTLALLSSPLESKVLYDFYLKGDSVENIARVLHFTPRYIYKIRKQAIAHYNELDIKQ